MLNKFYLLYTQECKSLLEKMEDTERKLKLSSFQSAEKISKMEEVNERNDQVWGCPQVLDIIVAKGFWCISASKPVGQYEKNTA